MATNRSHLLKVQSRWSKNYIFEKSVFLSALGFSNITFIIPSDFIIVPYLTLWMLDIFLIPPECLDSSSLYPDQARQFVGPDLGPNCLQRLSADNKKSPLASIELNTKQLVDIYG